MPFLSQRIVRLPAPRTGAFARFQHLPRYNSGLHDFIQAAVGIIIPASALIYWLASAAAPARKWERWRAGRCTRRGYDLRMQLTGLTPGTYKITEVVPSGYKLTSPTGKGYHVLTLKPGQLVGLQDFGNRIMISAQ